MTEHIVEIVAITSAIIAIVLALVALVFASSACETAARSHFLMNSFSRSKACNSCCANKESEEP